ncbi:MAG: AcrB/AcrD/AcrF family protein [Candidatus Hydrogenedens sp.]|nr:AcrB/AcrD/AcrF family protein [Candidatus Hydrogenedens sp.]
MRTIIAAFAANHVLANVVLCLVLVCGGLAATSMVRESMPEVRIDVIQIGIAFPGANPKEVEEGISRLVEPVVDGMEGVKSYNTYSAEGFSSTSVEIEAGRDLQEMKDLLQEAVDSIPNLPAEARAPRISIIKDDEEVINVALWGDLPERQMKAWAERVRGDLLRKDGISLVYVTDVRPYEISVEVTRARLLQYGLTVGEVSAAIQRASLDVSAGKLKDEGEEISIRAVGRRYDGEALESIPVKTAPDGTIITLGDIADVRDAFSEQAAFSQFNGKPCVLIEVYKAKGEDSLFISDLVRAYTEKAQAGMPPGLHITPCFDESDFIRAQISMRFSNGVYGLMLVLLVLWLFLNARLAFWVAMGIPVSLAGTFCVLWFVGASINQITLMSFIIVLGIVVDDAIVMGEAIFHHRKMGKGPLQAAVDGVSEVGMPVIAAVLTTVIAFYPASFVPGFLGQLMAIVPVVVISALLISLTECLLFLPAHLNNLPEIESSAPPRGWRALLQPHRLTGYLLETFAERYYLPAVRLAVDFRYVSVCIGVAVLIAVSGLFAGGLLRFVFWPPVDGDVMAAFVEFPPGTPPQTVSAALVRTREGLERVAARLETTSGEPAIENMHERIFAGAPEQGRVFVEFIPPSRRGVPLEEISVKWEEEVGKIPGAVSQQYFRSSLGGGGPQISIWLTGPNMDDLLAASEQLEAKLTSMDGVYQVENDFRPGRNELQVSLKPEGEALGLTMADVSRHLSDAFYGAEPQQLQRGRDEVKVRVRYPVDERATVEDLEHSRIRTPTGAEVPLLSVADFSLAPGYAVIKGTNGMRRLAVMARADSSVTTPEAVTEQLTKGFLDRLTANYPGMEWRIRGEVEQNEQTLGGIQNGLFIGILGIFVVMAAIFRSYAQPILILLIIPFGLVGAFLGHWILGINVTILSLFGIVALAGVVVNDAIVLVECFNAHIAAGETFRNALAMAGVRRFRAIFLTTVSTFAGLVPILTEKDLEAQLVIPMCASVAFGVLFATGVTLLLLPCYLAILNDVNRLVYYLRRGVWLEPEDVEPARRRHSHQEIEDAAGSAEPSPAS